MTWTYDLIDDLHGRVFQPFIVPDGSLWRKTTWGWWAHVASIWPRLT